MKCNLGGTRDENCILLDKYCNVKILFVFSILG